MLFLRCLVPIHCISVSWVRAAHLVFSLYVCCVHNPFEAPQITESDEYEANKEVAFVDVEASHDEDVCVE